MSSPAVAQGGSDASPTQTIDLRRDEVGIGEVLDQLDRELIGLKPVKTRIREIASLLLIERIRKRMGLTSDVPTLHMSFTGNPGTGILGLGRGMADILPDQFVTRHRDHLPCRRELRRARSYWIFTSLLA
jgi:hypothetical protein